MNQENKRNKRGLTLAETLTWPQEKQNHYWGCVATGSDLPPVDFDDQDAHVAWEKALGITEETHKQWEIEYEERMRFIREIDPDFAVWERSHGFTDE